MKFAFKFKKNIALRPKKNNSIDVERSQEAFKLYIIIYVMCILNFFQWFCSAWHVRHN